MCWVEEGLWREGCTGVCVEGVTCYDESSVHAIALSTLRLLNVLPPSSPGTMSKRT